MVQRTVVTAFLALVILAVPVTAGAAQPRQYGSQCMPNDTDCDGIQDPYDQCPTAASTQNNRDPNNSSSGCPARQTATPAVVVSGVTEFVSAPNPRFDNSALGRATISGVINPHGHVGAYYFTLSLYPDMRTGDGEGGPGGEKECGGGRIEPASADNADHAVSGTCEFDMTDAAYKGRDKIYVRLSFTTDEHATNGCPPAPPNEFPAPTCRSEVKEYVYPSDADGDGVVDAKDACVWRAAGPGGTPGCPAFWWDAFGADGAGDLDAFAKSGTFVLLSRCYPGRCKHTATLNAPTRRARKALGLKTPFIARGTMEDLADEKARLNKWPYLKIKVPTKVRRKLRDLDEIDLELVFEIEAPASDQQKAVDITRKVAIEFARDDAKGMKEQQAGKRPAEVGR